MAHQTGLVLLLILAIGSTAFADVEEPLSADAEKPLSANFSADEDKPLSANFSEDYFDQLVKEAINKNKTGTCPGCCPLGWVKDNNRCYIYHGEKMDWASAENRCLNFGANLMSVHSENEYQLAKALIRAEDPSENPAWLGLSNCQKKDNWFWSDGTRLTYTKWNPNEPNHLNGECCVHMNWDASQKNWNDIPCEHSYSLLCAKNTD